MEILIIGGFLGSGKTTILNKIIRGLAASGLQVAVIENEIGDSGVDDIIIGDAGVTVKPLFGGCVCCEISGNLIEAVGIIEAEVAPDWIIIEMTGFAFMDSIREVFRKYANPTYRIHTLSVADASRWDVFMMAMRQVIEHQLSGADIVILNKTDECPEYSKYLPEISEMSDSAPCIPISAKEVSDNWLWDQILGHLKNNEVLK